MARKAAKEFDAEQLLREFTVYDEAVDVVSCYQWVFTATADLAPTVRHFERYPRVPVDQTQNTPDFTVLFADPSGIVGEIARLGRADGSVESLCGQIGRYAAFTELPVVSHGPTTAASYESVDVVDVLVLTPVKTVKDAAQRIFTERLDDPEHVFSPARRPVLVQFAQNSGEYVFLIWPNDNGEIYRDDRQVVYGDIDPFVCRPEFFTPIKVRYGFMNDPVPALYMATRLWATVLPNRFWSDKETRVPIDELVEAVREASEGFGSVTDVRRGMRVLVAAGLARETERDKVWQVKRQSLRRSGREVHTAIAERIRKANETVLMEPTTRSPARRSRSAPTSDPGQASLFDLPT